VAYLRTIIKFDRTGNTICNSPLLRIRLDHYATIQSRPMQFFVLILVIRMDGMAHVGTD
jgi:hypothetical protein